MRPLEEIQQSIARSVEQRDRIREQLREIKRDFRPPAIDLTDADKARRQIDQYILTVLEIKDLEVEQAMMLGSLAAYYDMLGYDEQEIMLLQTDPFWLGSTDDRLSVL